MGGVLSLEEKKQLLPHLQGFKPHTLSSIIWDTVNLIGVDDQRERFGIHFDEPKNEEGSMKDEENGDSDQDNKQGEQTVTFWDGKEAHSLPLHIFIDILTYVGEETVKEYEANDLEEEKEIQTAVNQLKLSLEYLKNKLESIGRSETAEAYRTRLDEDESESRRDSLVDKVRERRGTQMWSAGESRQPTEKEQKKGIEGVMDRLPELHKRFGSPHLHKFRRSARGVQLLLQATTIVNEPSRKTSAQKQNN